jgi:hypothetical protein
MTSRQAPGQLAARGVKIRQPSHGLPPSPSRRCAAAGMEERQLLSKRRSHVSWRPKLPGQIEFGPTHTGPAAQEAVSPVAQT